jgi:hypothetical protein
VNQFHGISNRKYSENLYSRGFCRKALMLFYN